VGVTSGDVVGIKSAVALGLPIGNANVALGEAAGAVDPDGAGVDVDVGVGDGDRLGVGVGVGGGGIIFSQ